jgi:hypothetical protein
MNGNGTGPAVAPDRAGSSIVSDHPFRPRTEKGYPDGGLTDGPRMLQPNPFLCGVCRLAEAAHTQTTVKRERS